MRFLIDGNDVFVHVDIHLLKPLKCLDSRWVRSRENWTTRSPSRELRSDVRSRIAGELLSMGARNRAKTSMGNKEASMVRCHQCVRLMSH